MVCPECKIDKGCSCGFVHVEGRAHLICKDCKIKIEKLKDGTKQPAPPPNVQGV